MVEALRRRARIDSGLLGPFAGRRPPQDVFRPGKIGRLAAIRDGSAFPANRGHLALFGTGPVNQAIAMGNLLIFNLKTDADDDVLGFTTGWINALSFHFEKVFVLTMQSGRLALRENVT